MLISTLHPLYRLLSWCLLVLALQLLAWPSVLFLFLLLPLSGAKCLQRWGKLLGRSRWLLLSLFLILGWSVAGTPLWESSFFPAPSHEGLQDALLQIMRLTLMLAAVAILLETTPLPELMSACHQMLAPLGLCGVDTERVVARLSLVLHYADTLPQLDGRQRWQDWLEASADSASTGEEISLVVQSPRTRDRWLLCFSALLLLTACLT